MVKLPLLPVTSALVKFVIALPSPQSIVPEKSLVGAMVLASVKVALQRRQR